MSTSIRGGRLPHKTGEKGALVKRPRAGRPAGEKLTRRMKWRIWSMREAGYTVAKISEILRIDQQEIERVGTYMSQRTAE